MSISEEIKEKYKESDFDFDVLPIIEEVISEIEKALNQNEENWKSTNLSLGDKSRDTVHKWIERNKFLPESLSNETIEALRLLNKEVEEIISEGKIEDVIIYFEKLDETEKKQCVERLRALTD